MRVFEGLKMTPLTIVSSNSTVKCESESNSNHHDHRRCHDPPRRRRSVFFATQQEPTNRAAAAAAAAVARVRSAAVDRVHAGSGARSEHSHHVKILIITDLYNKTL